MADYPNTPVVSKIVLPSGNPYYIKDGDARDAIDALEQQIAGGMGFKIVWTQTDWSSSTAPTSAKLATIPKDVTVHYKSGASTATGTLAASASTLGNFYLIYSNTQLGSQDYYNEYATISESQVYKWEKIGDTRVDLTGVVTNVSVATKPTTDVIGSSSTFTITQPTIKLSKDSLTPAASITITEPTGSASASGDSVTVLTGLGTPSTSSVLTGVKVTTQPTVTLTANAASGTGRLKYVEDVTGGSITPTNAMLSATASGTAVSASGDNVTAVTGVSTAKLATTTVTGVSSTTTTASKATAATSQTTADGTTTSHQGTEANPQSAYNAYMLGDVSVANEILSIKGLTMDTQTTTQQTFTNVTVPVKNSSATTVATGSTTSSGSGATIATGSSGTDTVLGTASTFTVTNPIITLASGESGDVEVVTDVPEVTVTPTYKYMSGSASGTAVGANGTANAVTGYSNTTTDTVLGTSTTITVGTDNHTISGSASGANTAWNSKDQKTVLTDVTLSVTKGTNDGE